MASLAAPFLCTNEPDEVEEKSIILFDGVCNLCNGSVNFLIRRDRKNKFLFCSLQSSAAEGILKNCQPGAHDLTTIILVEGNQLYTKSTAILKIFRKIGGLWPVLYLFIIIPKSWRDVVYAYIAGNRYRWFGRKDTCMIPTPALKARFIE